MPPLCLFVMFNVCVCVCACVCQRCCYQEALARSCARRQMIPKRTLSRAFKTFAVVVSWKCGAFSGVDLFAVEAVVSQGHPWHPL